MDLKSLLKETSFVASRSSGAGGQHVNKVSSRITLNFNLNQSEVLTEDQKQLLHNKLSNRISKEGTLQIHASESRSQHKNKALAIERFLALITSCLKQPKKRTKTKPTKSSIEKRLKQKKHNALKKSHRKPTKM